jgi:hypothetical protein
MREALTTRRSWGRTCPSLQSVSADFSTRSNPGTGGRAVEGTRLESGAGTRQIATSCHTFRDRPHDLPSLNRHPNRHLVEHRETAVSFRVISPPVVGVRSVPVRARR